MGNVRLEKHLFLPMDNFNFLSTYFPLGSHKKVQLWDKLSSTFLLLFSNATAIAIKTTMSP